VGVIGTTTHWTAPWFRRMLDAFEAGAVANARAIHAQLLPSMRYVNSDDSVYAMSVKAMLRALGLPAGPCRLPLPPAPAGKEDEARAVWAALAR
jgi:4-hydroxy-tetrahydrodipicolinate synthase